MMTLPFHTLLGLFGMVIMTASFACRSDRVLRQLNILGLIVWQIHFLLLGAWSISTMLFLAMLMLVAKETGRDRIFHTLLAFTFLLLPLALGAWWLGYGDVTLFIPVIVTLFINGGMGLLSGHALTGSIAAGLITNALLAGIVGSWTGVATNLLNLSALVFRSVGISRQKPAPEKVRAEISSA